MSMFVKLCAFPTLNTTRVSWHQTACYQVAKVKLSQLSTPEVLICIVETFLHFHLPMVPPDSGIPQDMSRPSAAESGGMWDKRKAWAQSMDGLGKYGQGIRGSKTGWVPLQFPLGLSVF